MANGDNPALRYITRGSITHVDNDGNVIVDQAAAPRTATSYENSKYNISSTSYPSDLMSADNRYGGNYVIFYISVHEDSMLLSGKGGSDTEVPGGLSGRTQSELSGTAVAASNTVAGITAAKGLDVVDKATKAGGGVEMTDFAKGATEIAVGSIFAAATIATIGGVKKQYRTVQKAIALHMPVDLSTKYNVSWAEADGMALVSAIGAGAEGLVDALKNLPMNAIDAMSGPAGLERAANSFAGSANGAASYLAGKTLNLPGAGQALSKTAGVASNPKKEMIFKEVDFRTFTFTYNFFPRNADEAKAINEIIYLFKLHMHPEFKDANHFLYIYPSEFDIRYYTNGKENMNIHRHTSCVLTDMNVSYTPQGQFNSFADGMPAQINVTLGFRELGTLSKETIQDGF